MNPTFSIFGNLTSVFYHLMQIMNQFTTYSDIVIVALQNYRIEQILKRHLYNFLSQFFTLQNFFPKPKQSQMIRYDLTRFKSRQALTRLSLIE